MTAPEQMFQFVAQIGIRNFKLLRSMSIWVPWRSAELDLWLRVLHTLAKHASGLRSIELAWGADCEFPRVLVRGAEQRGLGDNLEFVRALGQIKGLEKLAIRGYYAKRWPAYLEQEVGVKVQAQLGRYTGVRNGDDDFLRELDKENLEYFRKYQQGTEDLIP